MTIDRGPLHELIGLTLLGIRYYGIGSNSEVADWFHMEHGRHIADFGLDVIADGMTCSITWRQAATDHALDVRTDHRLVDWLLSGWFEDVSDHPDWQPFVGRKIERVRWVPIAGDRRGPADQDPYAMELTVEHGDTVLIMAANLDLEPSDDISIVFGKDAGQSPPVMP